MRAAAPSTCPPESANGQRTAPVGRFILLMPLAIALAGGSLAGADTIELLSGAKVEGAVQSIDKEKKEVTFQTDIGGRKLTRVYTYDRIHAVTFQGKRYVINEKDSAAGGGADNSGGGESESISRADLESQIERIGRQPPEWYDDTPLNYPKSLDLSWPEPAPKGWNNQANVGQFIWDVINPNPNKWREGVKLMHHLLAVNKDNPQTQRRVMNELGRMYHDLLEDDARAAFWWKLAGLQTGKGGFGRSGPHLAACYYRLGNKSMAVELLNKLPPSYELIKIWSEIGETKKALELADLYAQSTGGQQAIAYMHAGEACRKVGRYQEALSYYELAAKAPSVRNSQERAKSAIEAIKLFELCDPAKVRDGSYVASALGYEGPVEVTVAVKSGRIESVRVTDHKEKQFYSALTDTPAQIIAKQHVKGVDATSSATITSDAIINATAKALGKGAEK